MQLPSIKTMSITVAAVVAAVGGIAVAASAASSDQGTVLVPIVPERVLDTRKPEFPISTLGPTASARLSLASFVPADARAVQLNVTAAGGTAASFLTLWPSGATKPGTSNLNWAAFSPPSPNGVTVKLGTDQSIDLYNENGNVNVIIDLMGYYLDAPEGGVPGPAGEDGVAGVEVVSSGTVLFAANVESKATASCPSGKTVISGGFTASTDIGLFNGSRFILGPNGTGTAWELTATSTGSAQNVTVSAVCATINN